MILEFLASMLNRAIFSCVFAVLFLSTAPLRAQKSDPFDLINRLPDLEKSRPVASTGRQVGKRPPTADRIDFEVSVSPRQVRRGETVRLAIRGIPKHGYHTYPITERADNPNQNPDQLSQIKLEPAPGLQPLWPIDESAPEWQTLQGLGSILVHEKEFTWSQDILALNNARPGPVTLAFTVKLQVCNSNCVWGEHAFTESIEVTDQQPVALSPTLLDRSKAASPEIKIVGVPALGPGAHQSQAPQVVATGQTNTGLLAFILQGIFWGAVSLVTPCVFPMIPITVSFFLKQSEKEHHRPITMALVYSATIVVVLTIAAVTLLSFFRLLSVDPRMNFVLGGLFIFFALNLFGMYEIELPAGLARFTSTREGKGGLAGTMFMALTFTIISFACVAPFLGGFGGTSDVSQLSFLHRFLGGLAFAGTFASPFLVLALFPTLLRKLPKSGHWLNSVKVVMGFLELAAAIKFLRMAELIWLPQPQFLTYDFVLGLYVALSILCGLYLLNLYRLPHDTPSEHLGVLRLMVSLVFLGLGFYLMPGLFKDGTTGKSQRPSGAIFAWLDSFLLPDASEDKELAWVGSLEQGIEDAFRRQRLVFLDFTGETCTNCKLNEANVFPNPEIKKLLKRYSLVQLYTDKVPNRYYSQDEQAEFGNSTARQQADAKKNLYFQREQFNTEQLPLYVILRPLAGGKFEVLARYDEGKINDEGAFVRFLSQPLAVGSTAVARN
jgi:thiol:disulfide interchange protein DsbD